MFLLWDGWDGSAGDGYLVVREGAKSEMRLGSHLCPFADSVPTTTQINRVVPTDRGSRRQAHHTNRGHALLHVLPVRCFSGIINQ
jgi:hypothetical protein